MSYNQLRQTFPPPPEGDRGTVTRPVRQPQPRGATPSPLADGGLEGSAMSEEERSAQLSEALRQAGFVPNKVRTHFVFAEVLKSMWSRFGFSFTGNFTEGWGYNLYAMNGRPGFDSGVSCRYIYQDLVVHFEDCQCPNRDNLICYISEQTGSLQLSKALVPIMKRMGLVVNMDGEVLDLERTQSIKHKLTLSRSSANPEVLFTEQLACCPHFTRRAVSSLQRLPGDWQADAAQITIRPRTYVQHLQQSGLKNSEPAADVDFSGLERALFCRVGEASGHLYMLLKYLLLRALPQALPDKIRPFTEVHCRQLLWYIISREHRNYIGDGESLLSRGRRGLQLMAELLEHQQQLQQRLQKGNSQRNVAFRNFFDQRLGVPFDEAVVGLVDRALLCRLLSNPTRLLTDQVDAYISRLRGLGNFSSGGGGGGGLSGSYFVFRPLLMTIPGCSSAAASRPTASQLAGLADYPMVGFRLYRALDILLDECRPDQGISAEFSALISSLRRCATTAAACLSCMMALKLRQGAGLAHQTLMQAGQISVTDCFEASNLTPSMVENALLKTDCAWLYRCKLIKDEHEDHVTECHGPGGTAFLAAYPRIRCLFFPATQKPILHSQHCSFVYRLRINFVALWHSLNTQLASDLGSYIRPSYGASAGGGGPESKSQLTTRMLLDQPDSVMDPQEIVAQVLICSSSPSRRLLLSAFKALVTGAAPFHRERGRDEWRWLNLVRLHLMGTWLTELRTSPGGNRSQREDFCELVSWCNEYDELFHCSIAGCGVSAMLHTVGSAAEVQARSVLQSVLETEIEQIFPLTKEAGHDRDLLVMELYARYSSDKKSRAHFEKRAKQLASH
ncbi:hypothetical protein BOX15_Mlig015656g2 [Macrostomum lignano]|uniref:Uncharacterized protein n=1 Tax=Macrostomum lignano TaxID=282301 RepID=A0A267H6B8_9PLAT|nr:hypothetical protein BOX15_Mlig015656g2 [Macrostomum lignano]